MNASKKLTEIRQLITKANNEEAAQQLLAFLANQPPTLRAWEGEVRNLSAQYKRAKQGQRTNTISFENAQQSINQVTQGLLRIVAQIEKGKAPQPAVSKPMNWLVIGVLVALGLSIGTFFYLRSGGTPPTDSDMTIAPPITVVNGEVDGKCPVYPEASPFNIMVLPFLPLDGEAKNVETALRLRLASKMEDYGIAGSVFTQMIDANSPQYPVNGQMASDLGKPCQAQLVIWGTTEEQPDADGFITTTKFRFIEYDNFKLTDLVLGLGTAIDTISSLSSIATTAELTDNIEQSLRLVFGLMAHETENYALAATVLDTVIQSLGGVAKNPKWGLLQADSYILSGQKEKALEVYRQMTDQDTANIQALLNKSTLEWQSGNPSKALADLDRTIEQDPNNTRALASRANVRVAQSNVAQAKADVMALEKHSVDTVLVGRIRANLAVTEAQEEAKYREAEQQLATNPNDTSAWRVKAISATNLGRYDVAEQAAERILNVDPDNKAATKTLQRVRPLMVDSMRLPPRNRGRQ